MVAVTFLLNRFNQKTDGSKTVVATDHRGHRIFHPTVVEIAFATRKRLDKRTHGIPRRGAKTIGTQTIDGNPTLPDADIAGVFNRIFVLRHQILVNGLADGDDSDFFHFTIVARMIFTSSMGRS